MTFWTEKDLIVEAKKYETRQQFFKANRSAYDAAARKKILDKVCFHMITHTKKLELQVYAAAKKYKYRSDFLKNERKSYVWAFEHNVLDKVCAHMVRKVKGLTIDEVHKVALKYKTLKFFRKNEEIIYRRVLILKVLSFVTSHMIDPFAERKRKVAKKVLKYKHRGEFKKKALNDYSWCRNNKLMDELCAHMTEAKPKLSIKEIKLIARKYRSRTIFAKKDLRAYMGAKRMGKLDEVCKHMPIIKSGWFNRIHSYESCLKKIRICKDVSMFIRKFPGEYGFLSKKGLLAKAYKETGIAKVRTNTSIGEETCLHYINKLLGIDLKKTRKLEWLISEKKCLMELDGYDKKNKIAFEFNGWFYHNKENINKRDSLKKKLCKKQGVKLIVVSGRRHSKIKKDLEFLKKQILKQLIKLNIRIVNSNAQMKVCYPTAQYSKKEINDSIVNSVTLKAFRKSYPKIYDYLNYRRDFNTINKLIRKENIKNIKKDKVIKVFQKLSTIEKLKKQYPELYSHAYYFNYLNKL